MKHITLILEAMNSFSLATILKIESLTKFHLYRNIGLTTLRQTIYWNKIKKQ